MKANRIHQFGGPEVLGLEDVPDPAPGAGEVLVRVRAAGVNPVETYIRAGTYGPREFPFTPGNDAAGVVEAVGAGVGDFQPGDRVYVAGAPGGTYAELAVVPEANVHPLPGHVSFAQGAAMGIPYATAYRALFHRARAEPGETVLVHGASGGVGTAAVQLARNAGMLVFGTAGTERGMQLVRDEGAHDVLDHRQPNYLEHVMDLTAGHGVDVILEMLANVNLGKDLTVLAPRGRVVVIGSRGPVEINPRETMRRDADIRGMILGNADADEYASIHAALVAGLDNKTLVPIVGQELPLADAPRAHEAVMKSGSYGKIVLVP